MDVDIEESWKEALALEFNKPYFKTLTDHIQQKYATTSVFPVPSDIFKAFALCPLPAVKVVILGQDPYHGKGQAHGLSFSVKEGIRIPPSLQNIYKEIRDDIGTPIPTDGNLERWARQGVLLLNAVLTVQEGLPSSHKEYGWETFTDAVIQTITDTQEHIVFLLWGAYAQKKEVLIDQKKHLVLKAPHPSPFSAHTGFFGSKHFSTANTYLTKHNKTPITW